MPIPFHAEITDAYLNSNAAFTSVSTVHSALRRIALQTDPSARPRVDFPSLSQVRDVLSQIDIMQTTRPHKIDRAEFDSIVSKNRGPGRQGVRRDQVQLDLAIFDRWWRSNRLRQSDGKALSFKYAAVFIDVYSRLAVVYPILDKSAATLKRVVEQAYEFYGGFDNLTIDGESAISGPTGANSTKAWARSQTPPVRIWINESPNRGKSNTHLVERLIRTLKEKIYKRARASGSRTWSLPDDAYWISNPPIEPVNATIPARKRLIISSDSLIPSLMNEVVRQYNLTRHSSLDASPVDVFFNGAEPLYARNERLFGTCTAGKACTSKQKRGVRRRSIKSLFAVGDTVRLLKTIRAFDKRSELKVWTAGLWRIVEDNFPSGLARFDQGPRPNTAPKQGESRRFIVQNVADPSKKKQVLHWQMQKIDPETTQVVIPQSSLATRMVPMSGSKSASNLTSFTSAPLSLKGTKEQAGRRGKRFTQSAIKDASTARARTLEDIGLTVDDEADQTPIRTRASSAPVASRVGRRKPPPPKTTTRKKKVFRKGDRVTAYYPSEKRSFTGRVASLEGKNVVVQFDPSDLEPNGSEAEFEPPYSFLKQIA